jgi:hypothetical protein
MSTKADPPDLRISSYMSLEQAMEEVRAYLDAQRSRTTAQPEMGNFVPGQLSMQGSLVDRMADIARRLGEVEPNSKLGPPGVFLKRIVRKLIGWHAKPAHQFNRTAVEAFRQIRQDMLHLQQQVADLSRKVDAERSSTLSPAGVTTGRDLETNRDELWRSVLALFRSLIDEAAVQAALQRDKPELLRKVESLLSKAEAELPSEGRRADASRL